MSLRAELIVGLASMLVALPAAASDPIPLGGTHILTPGETLEWKVENTLSDGIYAAIKGIVPLEGKLDLVEDRSIFIEQNTETTQHIRFSGKTVRTENFGSPVTNEVRYPLTDLLAVGRKKGSEWVYTVEGKDLSKDQTLELKRFQQRRNEESDLFEGVSLTMGESQQISPDRFLKAAGYVGASEARGDVTVKLLRIDGAGATRKAVIQLDVSLRAKLATPGKPEQRLVLKNTGTITRNLSTRLDEATDLSGDYVLSSELELKDGSKQPFNIRAKMKYHSSRVLSKASG